MRKKPGYFKNIELVQLLEKKEAVLRADPALFPEYRTHIKKAIIASSALEHFLSLLPFLTGKLTGRLGYCLGDNLYIHLALNKYFHLLKKKRKNSVDIIQN